VINWTATPEDKETITKIAQRAVAMLEAEGLKRQPLTHYMMDIAAVHLNIQPLRLADLLAADDFNFAHDVFGIGRHLNRDENDLRLLNCFLPRFSKHDAPAEA